LPNKLIHNFVINYSSVEGMTFVSLW